MHFMLIVAALMDTCMHIVEVARLCHFCAKCCSIKKKLFTFIFVQLNHDSCN